MASTPYGNVDIPHVTGNLNAPYDKDRVREIRDSRKLPVNPSSFEYSAQRMLRRKSINQLNDGDLTAYFLAMRKYSLGSPLPFSIDSEYMEALPKELLEPAQDERARFASDEEYEEAMDLLEKYLLERRLIPFSRKFMHLRNLAAWRHPLSLEELSIVEVAEAAIDSREYRVIHTFGLDSENCTHRLVYSVGTVEGEDGRLVPKDVEQAHLSHVLDYRFLAPWPTRL